MGINFPLVLYSTGIHATRKAPCYKESLCPVKFDMKVKNAAKSLIRREGGKDVCILQQGQNYPH